MNRSEQGGGSLDRDEMVRILEEIIRDEETNATARCTAIRTLLEVAPKAPSSGAWADLDELAPRRNSRTKAR
jgi:hypothetical protein